MGLGIAKITILNGLATIENLYGHARDIRITKDVEGFFLIECNFIIYKTVGKSQVQVHIVPVSKTFDNDFLTKTWEDVYTIVKEVLTEQNIEYTNEI